MLVVWWCGGVLQKVLCVPRDASVGLEETCQRSRAVAS
jgi:hypothetical protein